MELDGKYLADATGCNTVIFDVTDSTNSYAKRNALPAGSLVIAYSQTAGRGRTGHSFSSPKNGLYLSIVTEYSEMITVAAAVAVADVIEKYSKKSAKIKWVNDIFIDSKKVCGILCEGISEPDGTIKRCIVGIGINMLAPDGGFEQNIKDIAGNVFDKTDFNANRFTADLVNTFMSVKTSDNVADEYGKRMLYIGDTVCYKKREKVCQGTVLGIDERCGLIVQTDKGTEILRCGEVSIRPLNDF